MNKKKNKNLSEKAKADDCLEKPQYVVGMGASAGGLEALEEFFDAMPEDSGASFVLVTHLDPQHSSFMPELLQRKTKMPVVQIVGGEELKPNHVYVIPPNKNLSLENSCLLLLDIYKPRGSNTPIDHFFSSLAEDQGSNAVAVILSGNGSDGSRALKDIKTGLGCVVVQTEESSKYSGMPKSAKDTGLADFILAPGEMPAQLLKYFEKKSTSFTGKLLKPDGKPSDQLKKIFNVIRSKTGHDFSHYKLNTICRRVERRMFVQEIEQASDYVRLLQQSERETKHLFDELLIGVTSFFRDPEAFACLKQVLLKQLSDSEDDPFFRAWVAGCSTGEEAYSVAITLAECLSELEISRKVQIFASDIDVSAIDVARVGIFDEQQLSGIDQERKKRCFIKLEDGRYQIKKSLREMLVFAPHNVLADPPFTKLNLISCRNLLIYIGSALQKKMFPIFHYSLKTNGILFLGTAETIATSTDLFAAEDSKWKIFLKKPSLMLKSRIIDFPASLTPTPRKQENRPQGSKDEFALLEIVESILKQSESPPCVVIDENLNVIYFHGRMGRYLEPVEGRVNLNIIEMARPVLKRPLTEAIEKVSNFKKLIDVEGLEFTENGSEKILDLRVRPLEGHPGLIGMMLIIFESMSVKSDATGAILSKEKENTSDPKSKEELKQELCETKETLQATIATLEVTNEELKSTNEELQSTNEELQSTNEEMETSKEELQSLNEESITVNTELQSRVNELSKSNDDMKNLLDSTEIATVFLDADLCVRRFTPMSTSLISLVATDKGRSISHFATNLIDVDLSELAEKVLKDLGIIEEEIKVKDGRILVAKLRPYRTLNNVIDGVVITFEDVTQLKNAEEIILSGKNVQLDDQDDMLRVIVESVPSAFALKDMDLKYVEVNQKLCSLLGKAKDAIIGKSDDSLFPPSEAKILLDNDQSVLGGKTLLEEEMKLTFKGGVTKVKITKTKARGVDDKCVGVVTIISEIF